MNSSTSTSLPVELTPVQIRSLKLAKEGDLYPQDCGRWTHLNADVTFKNSDRFKERPIKVKFASTATIDQLQDCGLLQLLNAVVDPAVSAHGITMAGKMWLLKHK